MYTAEIWALIVLLSLLIFVLSFVTRELYKDAGIGAVLLAWSIWSIPLVVLVELLIKKGGK